MANLLDYQSLFGKVDLPLGGTNQLGNVTSQTWVFGEQRLLNSSVDQISWESGSKSGAAKERKEINTRK